MARVCQKSSQTIDTCGAVVYLNLIFFVAFAVALNATNNVSYRNVDILIIIYSFVVPEIGSCLLKALPTMLGTKRKLIVWSDSCNGQNKNFKMMCLWLHMVERLV